MPFANSVYPGRLFMNFSYIYYLLSVIALLHLYFYQIKFLTQSFKLSQAFKIITFGTNNF